MRGIYTKEVNVNQLDKEISLIMNYDQIKAIYIIINRDLGQRIATSTCKLRDCGFQHVCNRGKYCSM